MDASFEKIDKIIPHDNADSLEIAIVSNFPCVVRKGEFKEGDICFYIRDDAKLLGYDELQERIKRDKEASQTGDFVTQDCFTCTYQYQDGLLKYLGSGGRVKTIKLRGKTSMGILLKAEEVAHNRNPYCCYSFINEENYEGVNHVIRDPEVGADFLKNNFGIVHWEAPITSVGNMNVKWNHLPENLGASDEENWENLPESDLHIGSKCVLTKKLDGSSTCVTCYPDGNFEISSRRMTFNREDDPEKMNAYQKLTRDAVKAGLWWAKKHNKVIALRGECCCESFNKSSFNKDCKLNDFFLYGCNFPEEKDWFKKNGIFGTDNHFIKIAEEMKENGYDIKTVPVLGYDVVSKELIESFNNKPWDWGEGCVLGISCEGANIADSLVWHYKSKSREYLMKMK